MVLIEEDQIYKVGRMMLITLIRIIDEEEEDADRKKRERDKEQGTYVAGCLRLYPCHIRRPSGPKFYFELYYFMLFN